MQTPQWSCSQTETHVLLSVVIPNARIIDSQFEIANKDFAFSSPPYMLHLTFSDLIQEGTGEHALYNRQKQEVTIVLTKFTPCVNYGVALRQSDPEEQSLIPQIPPNHSIGSSIGISYGFDERFSGVLPDDGSVVKGIVISSERVQRCRKEEYASFNAAHFWSDQLGGHEEDGTKEALHSQAEYVPWYLREGKGRRYELPALEGDLHAPTSQNNVVLWNGNVDTLDASTQEMAGIDRDEAFPRTELTDPDEIERQHPCERPMGLPYQHGRRIAAPPLPDMTPTTREQELLATVAPWTLPIRDQSQVVCGLVDILLASVYEDITTCGECGPESVWTTCTVSSTLSWLCIFRSLDEVLLSFGRRVLSLPLYRSWDLVARCVHHTCMLLALGVPPVLRMLLRTMWFLEHDEHRHLLGTVFLDPYIGWVQGVGEETLRDVAQELHDAFGSLSVRSLGFDVESEH